MTFVFWSGVAAASVLGITWMGYPLGIFLLSLLYRRPRLESRAARTVSVVLATRDEPALIRRRVHNLLRADYPSEKLDIVVTLDAGSPYEPEDLSDLAARPRVKVLKGDGPPGKAPALNVGIEGARGEILVFADTHQRFAPQTISRLASAFSDPGVGGASGRLSLRRRKRGVSAGDVYWLFERWLRNRESRIHSPVGVTGAVSAVRRSLWEPLPEGLILDDLYTPMRLVLQKHRVAFVESAVAFETREPSPRAEYRRKSRTLTGVIQLCVWLPSVLVPWKNPLFFQFVLHKLARLLTPFAAGVVALWAVLSFATIRPELSLTLALIFGAILIWVVSGPTTGARNVRSVLFEIVLTQVAVVRATANGIRGNWDIWD